MKRRHDGLDDTLGLAPLVLGQLGTLNPDDLVEAFGASKRTVAKSLGVDVALLCRPLSYSTADRYAVRLGLHPVEVWGADWLRAEAETMEIADDSEG